MHLHFSRIHFVLCSASPLHGVLSLLFIRSLDKNILFFYYSYCPIFNIFYCAGHCIITSLLPFINDFTMPPSVAMFYDI